MTPAKTVLVGECVLGLFLQLLLGTLPKEGSPAAGYSSYDNLKYAEMKALDVYMPDNFLEALGEKGGARSSMSRQLPV